MMSELTIRPLTRRSYRECLQAMRDFTAGRSESTGDEIWLVEHEPVFTQGLAGRPEHLLAPGDIPVVATERGGQVTYHGPGQVVAYLMLDIRRRRIGIKELVCRVEQAIIDCLLDYGILAARQAGAPGVYLAEPVALAGNKIASLGLKVSRGRTLHGVALNVAMDLEPFGRINPCGYQGLSVVDMRTVLGGSGGGQAPSPSAVATRLGEHLSRVIMEPCNPPAPSSASNSMPLREQQQQ